MLYHPTPHELEAEAKAVAVAYLKARERTWVEPHNRDGVWVEGYWREGGELEAAAPPEMMRSWHLTDDPHFAFDPERVGIVNSTIGGDMGEPGIFVTQSPEFWFNRHDYVRPYIVEIEHPAVTTDGYYASGQDHYLPASAYAQSRVVRVIPTDAYVREAYGEPGWFDEFHGDLPEEWRVPERQPFGPAHRIPEGYVYDGPDVREMSPEERARHVERAEEYIRSVRPQMLRRYDENGEAVEFGDPRWADYGPEWEAQFE